jgi:hypothetical protein
MAEAQRSLALGGNTLPIALLRYNPDAYQLQGRNQRTSLAQREEALIDLYTNMQL